MTTWTLYGFWRSSATWRVRIALAHKGIAFRYVPVHLRRDEQHLPEFAKKNPMHQVPVLEIDDDDGGPLRLTQSLAIIEYLEERTPEPRLLPLNARARARARIIAEMINAGIQPLQNTGVQSHVETVLHGDVDAWVRHWCGRGLAALETAVAESAGAFCVGDEVSVADLCLVPQLHFARRFGFDVARYPVLARVDASCAVLPAFIAGHADAQPDRE